MPTQIAEWVKAGGVLVMHGERYVVCGSGALQSVAEKFGIHFNSVLRKHVIGRNGRWERLPFAGGGPIFHHPHTLYMKDVCTISVKAPAVSVLEEGDDIFMATAKYGKGTVFAIVDPWLYNEYTDGRKLPAEYDNYAGGEELVRWLLEQVPR